MILEVRIFHAIVRDVAAHRIRFPNLIKFDRVTIVGKRCAVNTRHRNRVCRHVVPRIEGRIIGYQHQIGAGGQRRRSDTGPRRSLYGIVHDNFVVRFAELDLIRDGPVGRPGIATGKFHRATTAKGIRTQRYPTIRIGIGQHVIILIDRHQRIAAGRGNAVLGRVVEIASLAHGIVQIVANEYLVKSVLQTRGRPGGSRVRFQRPRFTPQSICVIPAERETDSPAHIEVAERLSATRPVEDLQEFEIIGTVAGGQFGWSSCRWMVHQFVDDQRGHVRQAIAGT